MMHSLVIKNFLGWHGPFVNRGEEKEKSLDTYILVLVLDSLEIKEQRGF